MKIINLFKICIILMIMSFSINIVRASDDIFIVNQNKLSKNNDFTIILNEPINNYSVDENNIYLSTKNFFYGINKNSGIILFKNNIISISKIQISDNYIYVTNNFNVYQVNKIDGSITSKYSKINNDIFTYLNLSRITLTGTLTFALHNISSDVTEYSSLKMDSIIIANVNLTQRTYYDIPNGDTIIQNFTSLPMNLTLIPEGVISLHIHASRFDGANHDDIIWFDVGIVNSTGGNFSSIGQSCKCHFVVDGDSTTEYDIEGVMFERILNLSDRLALRVYITQTGLGTNPDITLYMDDLTVSRLTIPAIPIDLSGLINQVAINKVNIDSKVNKTGDHLTDNLEFDNDKGIISIPVGGITSSFSVSALHAVMQTNGTYLQTSIGGTTTNNLFFPVQLSTPPTYIKGGIWFNTTDNKLYVGGATAWEKITSI